MLFRVSGFESRVAEARKPVIVELFTSEGCSSCPPADEVLARLERTQPVAGAEIIALGEHVDYWNDIGWADPFSAPVFSERQADYSSTFSNSGVYTPQMVVDGHTEFIGSKMDRALEVIANAARLPKAKVLIEVTSQGSTEIASIQARITNLPAIRPGDAVEMVLAVTERDLQSSVIRGENAGRHLRHGTVVRQLKVIGSLEAPLSEPVTSKLEVGIDPAWRRDRLRIVFFLQERRSHRIIGAGAIKLDQSQGGTS